MARKKKPGDVYWKLIDSAFDAVSIYDGPTVFAEQFGMLKPEIGHLLAAHWCQSEVCNGGFHQFFTNSTGVLAPEALVGFQAIGIPEWAALLRSAMDVFGVEYPRDRDQRHSLMPQPEGERRAEWDLFHELDERFYEYLGRGEFMWEEAADAYASRSTA
jgi:hypothetical protein